MTIVTSDCGFGPAAARATVAGGRAMGEPLQRLAVSRRCPPRQGQPNLPSLPGVLRACAFDVTPGRAADGSCEG